MKSSFLRTSICVLLCSITSFAVAQEQGAVTGEVVCADNHRPARFAVVKVISDAFDSNSNGHMSFGKTGIDGKFTIPNVPVGTYVVDVAMPGYVGPMQGLELYGVVASLQKQGGQRSSSSTSIQVSAGITTSVNLSVYHGATLSGDVTFDDGSPAAGLMVEGLQLSKVEGAVATTVIPSTYTDDRGSFRIAGVPQGEYIIRVILPEGFAGLNMYPTYYGNVLYKDAAKPIKVQTLAAYSKLDIQIPQGLLHSVTGLVKSSRTDLPITLRPIRLKSVGGNLPQLSSLTNSQGEFVFPAIPSGTFLLTAEGEGSKDQAVTVGSSNVTGLVVVSQ